MDDRKVVKELSKLVEYKTILDNLETTRIYAGAEFERLCNSNQPVDAFVFQTVRDSIAANIRVLQTYIKSNKKTLNHYNSLLNTVKKRSDEEYEK